MLAGKLRCTLCAMDSCRVATRWSTERCEGELACCCGAARHCIQQTRSVEPPGRPATGQQQLLRLCLIGCSVPRKSYYTAFASGLQLANESVIHREAAEAKAAEAARKKAERDALLAEEDKSLPSRPGPKNAKTAVKKTRGLDLSSLDEALPALNASGIDNAVDALDAVEGSSKVKVSKGGKGVGNLKIAYQEFEDRMKAELTADGYYGGQTGKTKGHAERIIAAAWAKHPDNPKNQGVHVAYNATKEEIAKAKADHAAGIEARLGA